MSVCFILYAAPLRSLRNYANSKDYLASSVDLVVIDRHTDNF